jgi:ribosomal protein S18 acetylase RimI-like enzyme
MRPAYRIERYNKDNHWPIDTIAALHTALLPSSPIVRLGPRFLKQFYYNYLPCEGQIFGAIAYVDDAPAGFIAATHDSDGFMRSALRRHWLKLAWVIGLSILLSPRRIKPIYEAFRIMSARKPVQAEEAAGEILSMGVLPAYRSLAFINQTRIKISNDLMEFAMGELRAGGITLVRSIIDTDNHAAQFFYSCLGWVIKRDLVPEWEIPSLEFIWRPASTPAIQEEDQNVEDGNPSYPQENII